MARPRRLNKRVISMICEAISIGATKEIAAQYANIGKSTFFLWCKKGNELREKIENGEIIERKDHIYIELLDGVEGALCRAGIGWLQVIDRAAQTDPNWARYMLERHFADYRMPTRTEITGIGGNSIDITWKQFIQSND